MNNQPQKDSDKAEKERYLKQAIKEGLADARAGRVVDGKKVFAELHEALKGH